MYEDGLARTQQKSCEAPEEGSLERIDPLSRVCDLGVAEVEGVSEEVGVPRQIDRETERRRASECNRRGEPAPSVAHENRRDKCWCGDGVSRTHEQACAEERAGERGATGGDGPESPKAASAAPIRRLIASGSEKSRAEYANKGVPTATARVTATAIRAGTPRCISKVGNNAAASAEKVAELGTTANVRTTSRLSSGMPGARSMSFPSR